MTNANGTRGAVRRSGKPARKRNLPGLGSGIIVATSGAWVVGALFAAHTMFSAGPDRYDYKPQVSLGLRSIVAAASPDRLINVPKFSRLSETAESRAERLAAASVAAESTFASLAAQRTDIGAVKAALGPALVEVELAATFAGLQARRPGADAIRNVLAPALAETVIVAPRYASTEYDASTDEVEPIQLATVIEESQIAAATAPPAATLPQITAPVPVARPALVAKRVAPRTVIEKDEPASTALAFARPDNPMRKPADIDRVPWPDRGKRTAVYDISAGVVHMPNGEKLEAHSGIGNMRDNPNFAHVKMRGPTPPGTYKITMRESLFHGVEAVRLTPTNGIAPLGRTGLLAHSFLLRTRGDSHGCVAFADYPRFLKAFKRGEVDMMVIVPRLGAAPSRGKTLSALFSDA